MTNIDIANGLIFQALAVEKNSFDERLLSQKKIFLLQELGVDIGYSYNWYIRGPYSPDLMAKGFMYNSLREIHEHINDYEFLNFTDATLDAAFKAFYEKTDDEEYKALYRMYINRTRPKVVFEIKDLYEESPQANFCPPPVSLPPAAE